MNSIESKENNSIFSLENFKEYSLILYLFKIAMGMIFEYSKYVLESQNITYPWKENGKDSNMNIQPDLVLYQDKLFDNSKTRYDKDFLIRENVKFVMDAKYMEELKRHEKYLIAFYLHEYKMKNGFA